MTRARRETASASSRTRLRARQALRLLVGAGLALSLTRCVLTVDTAGLSSERQDELSEASNVDGASEASVVDGLVPNDGGGGDSRPPPVDCPPSVGADLCSAIPSFPSTSQIVDGIGDEFCAVPATAFDVANGVDTLTSPPPSLHSTAYLRIAWSAYGVHAHIAVTQASVRPSPPQAEIFNGDCVEVFLAGTNTLTGAFGKGTQDPGALQILAAPPGAAFPARAVMRTSVGQDVRLLTADEYAGRVIPTGYELELRIRWSDLMGPPGGVGSRMGADLAVDVVMEDGGRFQSYYFSPDMGVSTPCMQPRGHPFCDDRTWCTPVLQ